MSDLQTICVYCGAASDVDERYKTLARAMGDLAVSRGWRVVYGGGHAGLMGILADTVLAGGAEVIGVIPRHLQEREIAHQGITTLHITQTMHERQMLMSDLSDVFVILPGGLGTLAEFFEVLTWKQLGLHDKPIILVNSGGYWDFLISMLDKIADENFLHDEPGNLFMVVSNVDELLQTL